MDIIKIVRRGFFRLLVTLFFFQAGLAMAAEPPPGTVSIYADMDLICTLSIEEGQVDFGREEKGCKSSGYMKSPSISLNKVRSATSITLSAHRMGEISQGFCRNDGNFKVVLRTIQKDVSVEKLDIFDLMKLDTGTVITPGLRLISKSFPHPEFVTGIGCFRIEFN